MRNKNRILLVPGSTRTGSTNVAALRAAVDAAGDDVTPVLFEGLADLPAFNPDEDSRVERPNRASNRAPNSGLRAELRAPHNAQAVPIPSQRSLPGRHHNPRVGGSSPSSGMKYLQIGTFGRPKTRGFSVRVKNPRVGRIRWLR